MDSSPCPNLNHGRSPAPVRYCPDCGQVVNPDLMRKRCTPEDHATERRNRRKFCSDCGHQVMV